MSVFYIQHGIKKSLDGRKELLYGNTENSAVNQTLDNLFNYRNKRDHAFRSHIEQQALDDPDATRDVKLYLAELYGQFCNNSKNIYIAPPMPEKLTMEYLQDLGEVHENIWDYFDRRVTALNDFGKNYLTELLYNTDPDEQGDLFAVINKLLVDYGFGISETALTSASRDVYGMMVGVDNEAFLRASSFVREKVVGYARYIAQEFLSDFDDWYRAPPGIERKYDWIIDIINYFFEDAIQRGTEEKKFLSEIFQADVRHHVMEILTERWFTKKTIDEKISLINSKPTLIITRPKGKRDMEEVRLNAMALVMPHPIVAIKSLEVLLEQSKGPESLAMMYDGLGVCFRILGQYDESKKWFESALEQTRRMKKTHKDYRRFVAEKNIAESDYHIDKNRSLVEFDRLTSMNINGFNPTQKNGYYVNLVSAFQRSGQYSKEWEWRKKANEKNIEDGNPGRIIDLAFDEPFDFHNIRQNDFSMEKNLPKLKS